MTTTPMAVRTRPFAIEPVTNVMLPDGIFDNALYRLRIACHYTNTSGDDLTNVTVYLESVGDPGIVVTGQTYTFPRIAAGASVLVSWVADFEHARPGKPLVSFVARADGHSSARSIQQIFVSQTRYDDTTGTYTCTIPEGRLEITRVRVVPPDPDGGWWPGDQPGGEGRPPWEGPYVPTGITMTWVPNAPYAGTHGELPFQDPFWKIIGLIVLIVAAVVGIIAAALGADTFNVGVKGKFEETDPGVVSKCCTPAPGGGVKAGTTVAGVCGVIASVGLAVALSDEADPHWRGQAATTPAPGELTVSETVAAEWTLLDDPTPGRPYRAHVSWSYDRYTTGNTYHHEVDEEQTNTHLTDEVRVTTPDRVSLTEALWVRAEFVRPDGSSFTGPDLYAFALFRSPGGYFFLADLGDDGVGYDDRADDGGYSGGLALRELLPTLEDLGEDGRGVWKVYVFGQDVNRVAPGTPPEIAAQTIGGFFVGSAVRITFDPNLPCPLEAQGTITVT